MGQRFLSPQLPDGYFVLCSADGVPDARLRGDELVLADAETNTWVAYPAAGTPRWFRIHRQDGERIWNEDGTGVVHEQRVVALEDEASR